MMGFWDGSGISFVVNKFLSLSLSQLDHMHTVCTLLQRDNYANTSSLNFYRPDALPDAQPTVSLHCRQFLPRDAMHPRY